MPENRIGCYVVVADSERMVTGTMADALRTARNFRLIKRFWPVKVYRCGESASDLKPLVLEDKRQLPRVYWGE